MNDMLQNWINWIQYDELMNCTNNAPHFLLGAHDCGEGQVITAYRPDCISD